MGKKQINIMGTSLNLMRKIIIKNFKLNNVFIASLLIPSLLLPINFSSILLVVMSLSIILSCINSFKKKRDHKRLFVFLLPFFIFYFSIVISFFVDAFNGVYEFDFLLRNLIIIIVPVFVFSSNFTSNQIFKILKDSSITVTTLGFLLVCLWFFGYLRYSTINEFNKKEWFKEGILVSENSKESDSIFDFELSKTSKSPSFRRVVSLSGLKIGDSIVRELTVKPQSKSSNKDIWALIRTIDNGNNRGAWFNISNGQLGSQIGVKSESKVLDDGYITFTLKNKIDKLSTNEWFYISFVDGNGDYRLTNDIKMNNDLRFLFKKPKFYTDSNIDLLKEEKLFNYKITKFSFFDNYAHGTYFSLVFSLILVFLVFNSSLFSPYLRFFFIVINLFVIYGLASKAVIITLLLLFLSTSYKKLFNYKAIIILSFIILSLNQNSYVRNRFVDMYKTIINIGNKEELGELNKLSTNQRANIYKNYFHLIKQNYLVGYGNTCGRKLINNLYNHKFNAHCQYLQSQFSSGLLGFSMLILFCFSPFFYFYKIFNDKYGLMFYIFVLLLNFLFESILYRHWGLILVSFIYSLYFQINKSNFKWFQ